MSLSVQKSAFTLLLLTLLPAAALGQWVMVADFPAGRRDDGCAFALGGFGYYGCGVDEYYTLRNDWFRYDPTANAWAQVADLPGAPRQYASVFTCGGKAYLVGGTTTEGISNEVFVYDPATDTWEKLANAPFAPRFMAFAFAVGDVGYIGTGRNDTLRFNDFWKFDCTAQRWHQLDTLPFGPRDEMAAFSARGYGHALLGRDSHNLYSDHWRFDPLTGAWQSFGVFPGNARTYVGVVSTHNGALLSGGMTTTTDLNDSASLSREAWLFHPDGAWLRQPDLQRAKRGTDGFAIGDSVFVCNGLTHHFTRLAEVETLKLDVRKEKSRCYAYPNLVSDRVNIECEWEMPDGVCETTVYNHLGQVVWHTSGFCPERSYLDVSTLLTGFYYLEIRHSGAVMTGRFVVVR